MSNGDRGGGLRLCEEISSDVMGELCALIAAPDESLKAYGRDGLSVAVKAVAVKYLAGRECLVLRKKEPFESGCGPLLIIYDSSGTGPRGFSVLVLRETVLELEVSLPRGIYRVQRRRQPRLPLAPGSKGTFFRRGYGRLFSGILRDIGLRGVKISRLDGDAGWRPGEIVGPLLMNICGINGRETERVLVPEVKICYVRNEAAMGGIMGLFFGEIDAVRRERLARLLARPFRQSEPSTPFGNGE